MSCKYPLKGYRVGKNLATGKDIIKVLPYCSEPWPDMEVIPIPCGRCMDCRLQYARQWANRCMLELKYHGRACFVTLTYDPLHVPSSTYYDNTSGKPFHALTLCQRDLQLFIKRVRRKFPGVVIRFFACGEYGPSTFRPHYHIIFFGIDFSEDRLFYKKSDTGFPIYRSPILDELWSFPPRNGEGSHTPKMSTKEFEAKKTLAGIATVQDVNWDTCCYVARYVTKKLNGAEVDFYEMFNLEPPFLRMSRRPGIGRQYFDEHPDLYNSNSIYVATPEGGLKFSPPKYFDRLLEEYDPEQYADLKETRARMAVEHEKLVLSNTDLEKYSYLAMEDEKLRSKVISLKRGDF